VLSPGAYFNAVELSKIATDLDEAERTTLIEGAMDEASLEHIMKQPSSNMDDSGFFSGQVGMRKGVRGVCLDGCEVCG